MVKKTAFEPLLYKCKTVARILSYHHPDKKKVTVSDVRKLIEQGQLTGHVINSGAKGISVTVDSLCEYCPSLKNILRKHPQPQPAYKSLLTVHKPHPRSKFHLDLSWEEVRRISDICSKKMKGFPVYTGGRAESGQWYIGLSVRVTPKDGRHMLDISEVHFKRLVLKGKIRCVHVGKHDRFVDYEDVVEFVKRYTRSKEFWLDSSLFSPTQ